MAIHLRSSVRGLILLVALCACFLAAIAVPLHHHERYERLKRRWEAAILSYEAQRPPSVGPQGWQFAISLTYNVWGNSLPERRVPNERIEAAVARLEGDAARATPETAARLLVRCYDLLLEIRPDNERFIRGFQAWTRDSLTHEAQKARAASGRTSGTASRSAP